MKKPRILIFTYADTNSHHGCSFNDLAKITNVSKEVYCKTHDYDFLCKTDNIRTDRPIGWEKVEIICNYMDEYDYIFYIECDATIVNHTIKIENIIDDNYDIVIGQVTNCKDYIQVNAGVLLVRCSEWSKASMTNKQ